MAKKISIVSVAGTFLALSLLTPAQTAPKPISAPALGVFEGMLNFCGKVNPQSADKYKEMAKSLTKDQPAAALAEIRDSREYKDSAGQIGKKLGAMSTKEALATCNAH